MEVIADTHDTTIGYINSKTTKIVIQIVISDSRSIFFLLLKIQIKCFIHPYHLFSVHVLSTVLTESIFATLDNLNLPSNTKVNAKIAHLIAKNTR